MCRPLDIRSLAAGSATVGVGLRPYLYILDQQHPSQSGEGKIRSLNLPHSWT